MGEEFKDFEVEAPVLTLEPDLTEEKEEIAAKEPEKPQEPAVEEPVLSPQEQKIVEDFAAKIDIENTNQILQLEPVLSRRWQIFLILPWQMSVPRILAKWEIFFQVW